MVEAARCEDGRGSPTSGPRGAALVMFLGAAALPALLGGGCGAGSLRYRGAGTPGEGGVRLDVPLVRQEDRRTCGFAAVEMLSRYYETPIAEADRERLRTEANSERGVSGRLLKEVLERNGFRVYIFGGKLLDEESPRGVAYHLKKGRPVVVMLSRRGRRHHYMVVSGLDAERDLVVGEDPGEGEIACDGRVFREMWERSSFFALLAVPAELGSGPEGDDE